MMKFTATFLSLAVAALANLTPERATSDDVASQLYIFLNQQIPSGPRISTALSGKIIDVPMDYKWVTKDATFTGDTQQLLYGTYYSARMNQSQLYIGYETGTFLDYSGSDTPTPTYKWRPPGDPGATTQGSTACVAGLNSPAYPSMCRPQYRFGVNGIPVNDQTQSLWTSQYDPRNRSWYITTKKVAKPTYTLTTQSMTFSYMVPQALVSFSVPFYDGTSLWGVGTVDVNEENIQVILNRYKTANSMIYIVDSSTYFLVSTSTNTPTISGSSNVLATSCTNPWIASSANFLSNGNKLWNIDGDYSTVINGKTWYMNLKSMTDATFTLTWKLVVMSSYRDPANPAPDTDYVQSIQEKMVSSVDTIVRYLDILYTVPAMSRFLHGADDFGPLTNKAYPLTVNVKGTGQNQQTSWAMDRMLNVNTGIVINSFAHGYQDGAYLGYINPTGNAGARYHAYRPADVAGNPSATGCAAMPGYAAISTNCTVYSTVDAKGLPVSKYYQLTFDPRVRPWYTSAKNQGGFIWAGMQTSAFFAARIICLSVPIYPVGTADLKGVTMTCWNLQSVTNMFKAQNYGDHYTGYMVQKSSGFLMGTSLGFDIYNSTSKKFIQAINAPDNVIKTSYSYLQTNSYLTSSDVTVAYAGPSGTTQMQILSTTYSDSSKAPLPVDIVWVRLF